MAIDVNPSIELGINRLDRVASTKAYNEDGAKVLAIANVEGDTYEEAMTAIEGALATYLDSSSAITRDLVSCATTETSPPSSRAWARTA